MNVVLSLIGAAAILSGMALSLTAFRRYRAEEAPVRAPSSSVRHWRPVWMMRNYFEDERGYRLFVTGTVLLSLGALVLIPVFVWL